METIMFIDTKQANLMRWIKANLSDDPNRSISKFMLDPEHDRVMATNGYVIVIASGVIIVTGGMKNKMKLVKRSRNENRNY